MSLRHEVHVSLQALVVVYAGRLRINLLKHTKYEAGRAVRHMDVEESDDLLLELLDLQRLGDGFDLVVWDWALIFLVEAAVSDSLLQTALVPVRLDPLVHLIAQLRVELAHQQLEAIFVD